MELYKFLDIFFLVFHTLLTLFNLLGWMWKKTRKLNLITLLITGASWFILGIFYGIGYCPLTEWHWRILEKLGRKDIPSSYIKYIVDRISGFDMDVVLVEWATSSGFFIALTMAIILNARDYIKVRRHGKL